MNSGVNLFWAVLLQAVLPVSLYYLFYYAEVSNWGRTKLLAWAEAPSSTWKFTREFAALVAGHAQLPKWFIYSLAFLNWLFWRVLKIISFLPRLFFKLGECPACAGFWLGWGLSWWTLPAAQLDMRLAIGGLAIFSTPVLWWLMSRSLLAQQKLNQSYEAEEEPLITVYQATCGNGHSWEIVGEYTPYARCPECGHSQSGLPSRVLRPAKASV